MHNPIQFEDNPNHYSKPETSASHKPVSNELFNAIQELEHILVRDYGSDYAFKLTGNGYVLAESDCRAIVIPVQVPIGWIGHPQYNQLERIREEYKPQSYCCLASRPQNTVSSLTEEMLTSDAQSGPDEGWPDSSPMDFDAPKAIGSGVDSMRAHRESEG